MSGRLFITYLENGNTQKTWDVAAATEINVSEGVLFYKDGGKLRGFSLVSVISFSID